MAHELDVTYTPPSELIPIVGLGVADTTRNVNRIKKQIHLAIVRGISQAVEATIQLALLIVPESHPGGRNIRPYPPSYETEQLMNTYIDMLRMSLTRMKRGKTTLRPEYVIQQLGWDMVSYAEHVNKMTNVRWTKATSESGFIEKLNNYLCNLVPLMVQQELQAIDHGQQLLYGGAG